MGKDNGRRSDSSTNRKASPGGIARLRGDTNVPSDERILLGRHERLGDALDAIVRSGDAVIVGGTRDGGAICFTVLSGSDREKLYAGTDEELGSMIESIIDAYTAAEIASKQH